MITVRTFYNYFPLSYFATGDHFSKANLFLPLKQSVISKFDVDRPLFASGLRRKAAPKCRIHLDSTAWIKQLDFGG